MTEKYLHNLNRVRGEKSSQSKLTEAQVREIRQRYAAGGITQHQLAEMYGIAQSRVREIICRKAWKHVE